VRLLIATLFLFLCGCRGRLERNWRQDMSSQEMLNRASLVFVGVIEKHHFESPLKFSVNITDAAPETAHYWRVLRRDVRVELVIRGSEKRRVVEVYEVFWTGGTSGDWNSTEDQQRALFLVYQEQGRYRVVRDWWRSIFPVTNGPHTRLPLDDSHPLWERIALMNWWMSGDESLRISYPTFRYADPGQTLSLWRMTKLYRGLVRHPSSNVRVMACRELLRMGGWGQDECWDALSNNERSHLRDGGSVCCTEAAIIAARRANLERSAESDWSSYPERDMRRLYTAVSNPARRRQFCQLYRREYPEDQDNGCPAGQPPPATIVTERGDVPLFGAWPRTSQ
jgi:hypothetical protein